MRWLLVSSQHHPSHGGIGTYVAQFIQAAVDAGWRVDLLTRPGQSYPRGAHVHEVTTSDMNAAFNRRIETLRRIERVRPYRYALWSHAVAQQLAQLTGEYDAIEFVDCQAEGYASLGSRHVRQRYEGVPMILHAHTPMFVEEAVNHADPSRFGRSIYHRWERQAIALADGVIITSAQLQQKLPPMQASAIIPYPIVVNPLQMPKSSSDSATQNETIVLVGSVQPRKGVDVWGRSLNHVLRKRPRANALLIGPDTPTAPDGGSMADYVKQLIDAPVHSRFSYIGSQPHTKVLQYIQHAALVVVPSLFESFSFVAAEAIAAERPVIVSDHVGIGEHVPSLPRVKAGEVEPLAAMQIAMLEQKEKAKQLAAACHAELLEACSPHRHIQQRIAFWESLQARVSQSVSIDDATHCDTAEELESFIKFVEEQERSFALASSERS